MTIQAVVCTMDTTAHKTHHKIVSFIDENRINTATIDDLPASERKKNNNSSRALNMMSVPPGWWYPDKRWLSVIHDT